jgi:hypothetical protein
LMFDIAQNGLEAAIGVVTLIFRGI